MMHKILSRTLIAISFAVAVTLSSYLTFRRCVRASGAAFGEVSDLILWDLQMQDIEPGTVFDSTRDLIFNEIGPTEFS